MTTAPPPWSPRPPFTWTPRPRPASGEPHALACRPALPCGPLGRSRGLEWAPTAQSRATPSACGIRVPRHAPVHDTSLRPPCPLPLQLRRRQLRAGGQDCGLRRHRPLQAVRPGLRPGPRHPGVRGGGGRKLRCRLPARRHQVLPLRRRLGARRRRLLHPVHRRRLRRLLRRRPRRLPRGEPEGGREQLHGERCTGLAWEARRRLHPTSNPFVAEPSPCDPSPPPHPAVPARLWPREGCHFGRPGVQPLRRRQRGLRRVQRQPGPVPGASSGRRASLPLHAVPYLAVCCLPRARRRGVLADAARSPWGSSSLLVSSPSPCSRLQKCLPDTADTFYQYSEKARRCYAFAV